MAKNCCTTMFDYTHLTSLRDTNPDYQLAVFIHNVSLLGGGNKITRKIMLDEAKGLWKCNLKDKYKWIDIKNGNWEKIFGK